MCTYFDKDVELGELHECMYCNFCENYIHCIYSGCEKWCAVSNCKCTQSPCKYYECVFNPLEISKKKCFVCSACSYSCPNPELLELGEPNIDCKDCYENSGECKDCLFENTEFCPENGL